MKFQLKTLSPQQACLEKSDALILVAPAQDELGGKLQPKQDKAFKLGCPLDQALQGAQASGDFNGKSGKTLLLYSPPQTASRIAVVALAQQGNAKAVRDAVAAAMAQLKGLNVKKLTVCLADEAAGAFLPLILRVIADSTYVYTTTYGKDSPSQTGRQLTQVTLGVVDSSSAAVQAAFAHAQALVLGVELTKEWANRPANYATPTLLGEAAKALAKAHPALACQVLMPKELEKLGMGSFLSVARGSNEPPRFIVLKYLGAPKEQPPQVLVGKGVTFDSGGISIKGGGGMDEMKFDMCGAASVLGVFRALAQLQPALNVIGLIPATENLPSGHATKPGDVVTAMDGQTIEVLNTDAEGRLILNDALVYAKRFHPAAVVDIATLTGACGVALGSVRAGLFSPDHALAESLLAAGERALDLAWRMPLDDEYGQGLRSNFADVANIASGGGGGSITAAKFLERFTQTGGQADYPWAHLDIAAVAWRGGAEKGATARPVGLLLEWLLAAVKPAEAKRASKAPAKAAPRSVPSGKSPKSPKSAAKSAKSTRA